MNYRRTVRRWSWLVLAGLLTALLFFATLTDANTAGEREVTYLMAAASLAWDGDLSYGREDYDRYVRTWEREPEAVALATADGSGKIGFGRPPVYAVVAAPFVRVSPRWGLSVLNWLLLALAAAASALVLERSVGPWAPAWIALCVAGTTAFTLLPLPSPELFRLAVSAVAWALVVQIMPSARRGARRAARRAERRAVRRTAERATGSRRLIETTGRTVLRWSLVGCLLALAVVASVDGFVLLPALGAAVWFSLLQPRRRLAAVALSAAAVLTFAAVFGVATLARGGAGPVEHEVFDRGSGFPAVDFEVEEWGRTAGPRRDGLRAGGGVPDRPQFDARAAEGLRLRTLLYAFVGRAVGFLPYCVPLVWAACWAAAAGGWRRVLLGAALGSLVARALLFPFDLGDERAALGPGGIGALAPMFWFLAARLSLTRILGVAVSAALVLYPLWLQPDAALRPAPPPAGLLKPLLPQETTQRLQPAELPDLFVGDLWLRPIAGRIAPFGEESVVIRTPDRGSEDPRHAEFLVAWEDGGAGGSGREAFPRPARLEAILEGSTRLEVVGAELEERRTLPSGRTAVGLRLAAPVARHRLWWSKEPVGLHRLRLTLGSAGDAPNTVYRLELRPR